MTEEIKNETEVRAIAYYYVDKNLGNEKYPVYAGTEAAWWMDGGIKLQELLNRFKFQDTVKQACYMAGISEIQYKYFKSLHPWLLSVIQVYKTVLPAHLKNIILEAALGNPGKNIKPNAKMALGSYGHFKIEETEPDLIINRDNLPIPEGGSVQKFTQENFVDVNGNVVMKRKTAQFIEKLHGEQPA